VNYRITIKDGRFDNKTKVIEVEADTLASALFVAGVMHDTVEFPEVLEVVKAETPAGWIEVPLP
jgi:hypothetical protein